MRRLILGLALTCLFSPALANNALVPGFSDSQEMARQLEVVDALTPESPFYLARKVLLLRWVDALHHEVTEGVYRDSDFVTRLREQPTSIVPQLKKLPKERLALARDETLDAIEGCMNAPTIVCLLETAAAATVDSYGDLTDAASRLGKTLSISHQFEATRQHDPVLLELIEFAAQTGAQAIDFPTLNIRRNSLFHGLPAYLMAAGYEQRVIELARMGGEHFGWRRLAAVPEVEMAYKISRWRSHGDDPLVSVKKVLGHLEDGRSARTDETAYILGMYFMRATGMEVMVREIGAKSQALAKKLNSPETMFALFRLGYSDQALSAYPCALWEEQQEGYPSYWESVFTLVAAFEGKTREAKTLAQSTREAVRTMIASDRTSDYALQGYGDVLNHMFEAAMLLECREDKVCKF